MTAVDVDRIETRLGPVAYRRTGVGLPLVLLHGGLGDGRSWAPQLDSLADEHDVVAWDAPGCGGSGDPVGELHLGDYADAVADLVVGLGLGPVDLAGHSFGAGLAIEVCSRYPQLVRSLVLSGAYAGWRGSLPPVEVASRLDGARADLAKPHEEWVEKYLAGFFAGAVSPDVLQAVRSMMYAVRPAGAIAMATAFAEADLRPVLPGIGVPTLLVRGADDVRSSSEVVEALLAAIPGARLVVVPNSGHDVNLEAPEEYDAAVRSFLEEYRPGLDSH